jgi:hypothetical protein
MRFRVEFSTVDALVFIWKRSLISYIFQITVKHSFRGPKFDFYKSSVERERGYSHIPYCWDEPWAMREKRRALYCQGILLLSRLIYRHFIMDTCLMLNERIIMNDIWSWPWKHGLRKTKKNIIQTVGWSTRRRRSPLAPQRAWEKWKMYTRF